MMDIDKEELIQVVGAVVTISIILGLGCVFAFVITRHDYGYIDQAFYETKYNEATFICDSSGSSLYFFTMIPKNEVCSFNASITASFDKTRFSELCHRYGWEMRIENDSVVGSQFFGYGVNQG